MKITTDLLKQFLDTDASVTEISEKLTEIGLEVEEVIDAGESLKPFIIAEIKSVTKHPNADKLNVLEVFTGKETLQIVCGAPNVRAGLKGVLAREGDIIPCYNEALKKGVIRGVESQGMMCSEKELGLGDNHDGIMDLRTDAEAGTPFTKAFNFDTVIDINVTPNRPDCFGVYGVAKDLAAKGVGKLKNLPYAEQVKGNFKSPIKVISTDENCPLFVGRYIKGVKNCKSPEWMQKSLKALGLRPISALVDITNYMTVAFARPQHVFDADTLKGNITARKANNGEKLLALNEKEYELNDTMCVIADDEMAKSIAGIMGGEGTGCSDNTTNVFLECAYFNPISIAKTGRDLNITSDARTRFERGVDYNATVMMAEYATNLILEICGGEASELEIAGVAEIQLKEIDFDYKKVNKICGIDIDEKTCFAILNRLGFENNGSKVKVPTSRPDVEGAHDLVEEVLRIYGYDKLPINEVKKVSKCVLTQRQRREIGLRRALANLGLNQTITWSFFDSKMAKVIGQKGIKLANPISSELDEMRSSLIPNLINVVKKNIANGYKDLAFFEIGPVFYGSKPNQQSLVATTIRVGDMVSRNWDKTDRKVDVFDVKSDAYYGLAAIDGPVTSMQTLCEAPSYYHPARSGAFKLGKNVIAYFGELHPMVLKEYGIKERVYVSEIMFENVPEPKNKKNKSFVKYDFQSLTRDFAFVVDEKLESEKVANTIKNVDKKLISEVRVFDVYKGDKLESGKKSLAFEVLIEPKDKTLNEAEIESLMTRIIANVTNSYKAELRA
ncbi:MAG: Phenylalanine--tRNA ligase beta subunit [Alphaproteobacteria bacterium ADurb.Bin438]|nr:MAG: Phenylalanine--tRNA ligase beta subunit [Alphaproteobacteria bacterium ADurb.Bin438]